MLLSQKLLSGIQTKVCMHEGLFIHWWEADWDHRKDLHGYIYIYIWLPQWWQNLLIQLSLEVLYLLSIICCRNYRFLLMFVTLIIDDHQHHKAIAIMLNLLNTKQSVFFVLYVFVISYFILFFFFLCDINFFLSLGWHGRIKTWYGY